MTQRTGVGIVLLLLVPSSPLASQAANPVGFSARSVTATVTEARGATVVKESPICDGSQLRSARHRAGVGLAIMSTGLPVSLLGMYRTAHSSSHPEAPMRIGVSAGAALAVLGFAVMSSARPDDGFWQSAIQRMKPGETRTADVRTCLLRPMAVTSSDSSEEWTYLTSRGVLSGRVKMVRLSFRDSVLVGIRRAEVDASVLGERRRPLVLPASLLLDPH